MNSEQLKFLKDLSELLEKGRISQSEYEALKAQLLRLKSRVERWLQKITLGLRSISPQVAALFLVLLFFHPVRKLINNASEIGFGDVFAVKVEQALKVENPELLGKVNKLSREELVTLLNSGDGSYQLFNKDNSDDEISLIDRFQSYSELQKKGLLEADTDLESVGKIFESKTVARIVEFTDAPLKYREQKYYSLNDFSQEEIDKIENASARLSESGKQVHSLIVSVASQEISKLK